MLATAATLAFLCMPITAPGLTPPTPAFQEPERPEVVVERGYGLQILAADGLGLGLVMLGASSENEELMGAGMITMWLAPGAVHAAHGRGVAAVTSAVMRPALLYGGMALGASMADCESSDEMFCGLGEVLLGGVVGYGTAVILDSAYLARGKRTVGTRTWAPHIAPSPTGVQVGLGGTF